MAAESAQVSLSDTEALLKKLPVALPGSYIEMMAKVEAMGILLRCLFGNYHPLTASWNKMST
jgi:hypothetical protein